MNYLVTFLEGIVTFVSPCLLPLLPVYLTYFAGGADSDVQENTTWTTLAYSCLFVLGFTVVFVSMGALSGSVGMFLAQFQRIVSIVCGAYVILLGLGYIGVIPQLLPSTASGLMGKARSSSVRGISSFLLGLAFAVAWTPCVGTFLAAALSLAASSASTLEGVFLLLCYSAGLGVPFVLSALAMQRLTGAFDFLKRNYTTFTRVCGILLIVLGVVMML